MTILTPSRVSSRRFHHSFHDGRRSHYVAEASDLGVGFGCVYDDAADEGLTLVSDRTGTETVFVVDRTETREGETVAWHLVPAEPGLLGVATMTIFND